MDLIDIMAVTDPTGLIKIEKDGKLICSGHKFTVPRSLMDMKVISVRMEPELRRKDWKDAGTWAPLNPDILADYKFSDMELRIYMKVIVE